VFIPLTNVLIILNIILIFSIIFFIYKYNKSKKNWMEDILGDDDKILGATSRKSLTLIMN
jgi:TM2 domain-containing membrane protein YozV